MRTLTLWLVLWLVGSPLWAAESDQIKAAFVVNFAKLTRWPAEVSPTICLPTVREPVGIQLVELQEQGKTVLPVTRGVELRPLQGCGLVYLSEHDHFRQQEILAKLGNRAVLTISDVPGFIEVGGMVELFREGRKYRFRVNIEAVERAGLEIDARLLALARP